MESYSQSQLAITMWSKYLANTFKEITVIPVNPGSLLDKNVVYEAFLDIEDHLLRKVVLSYLILQFLIIIKLIEINILIMIVVNTDKHMNMLMMKLK